VPVASLDLSQIDEYDAADDNSGGATCNDEKSAMRSRDTATSSDRAKAEDNNINRATRHGSIAATNMSASDAHIGCMSRATPSRRR
jgi:hypothetical protein